MMPRGVLKNEKLCALGFILSVPSYLSSSPTYAVCVSLHLCVSVSASLLLSVSVSPCLSISMSLYLLSVPEHEWQHLG